MNRKHLSRRSTVLLSCAVAIMLPMHAFAGDATTKSYSEESKTESMKHKSSDMMDRAGSSASDLRMHLALETELANNDELSAMLINTDVRDGVALLEGEVKTDEQRELATELAESVEGVQSVQNELRVTGNQQTVGERLSQDAGDAALTARVKTRLLTSRNTSGLAINVDTENDVVTLNGEVETDAERELAVLIAANTPGVEDVRDNLSIEED